MRLALDRPWLLAELAAPMPVLGWAPHRGGRVIADRIVWREVRNADLPRDLDALAWFRGEMDRMGHAQAVGMLTSRDIRAMTEARVEVEGVSAHCVATTGLSNAESVGARMDRTGRDWGTINVAVEIGGTGLTEAARLEALSIATEARTAAIIGAAHDLPTGRATGTGTDCIAIAAPEGACAYAGKHTALGEALGRAVRDAVTEGVTVWMATVQREGVL